MDQAIRLKTFYVAWIEPVIGWVKEMTRGERALLFAVLFLGGVGAYGTHQFFAQSRGAVVGWLAAIGIELLYIGSAGVAVKLPGQIWLSRLLMLIGAFGSAFFNTLVGLRERMPELFGLHEVSGQLVEGGAIAWPSGEQWAILGTVSLVEGVIIPVAALLVALLLHSMTSHRLIEADDKQKQIEVRKQMKPFECPFCTYSDDTPAKLWGHFGRCPDGQADPRSTDDKRALVRLAVDEGKKRILEG